MKESNELDFNTKFQLYYSFYLERMTANLNRRTEEMFYFSYIMLGFFIISPGNDFISGSLIILLATLHFLYKPGVTASLANAQESGYAKLINSLAQISPQELNQRMQELSQSDSRVFGSLERLAHIRASIALGQHNSGAQAIDKLTPWERLIGFLAGGIPT